MWICSSRSPPIITVWRLQQGLLTTREPQDPPSIPHGGETLHLQVQGLRQVLLQRIRLCQTHEQDPLRWGQCYLMCVQWNIYLFVIAHCCGNSGCRGNQLLLKRKRKTMYSCPVMSMTCDEIILSLSKQINDYLIALPPLADNEAMATCVFGSLVLIVCHCSRMSFHSSLRLIMAPWLCATLIILDSEHSCYSPPWIHSTCRFVFWTSPLHSPSPPPFCHPLVHAP